MHHGGVGGHVPSPGHQPPVHHQGAHHQGAQHHGAPQQQDNSQWYPEPHQTRMVGPFRVQAVAAVATIAVLAILIVLVAVL